MGARISPGFTIIETVLFLSVTGLLVMGVLIGTGSALNNQRYQDSIESFKDLLQTQYSELGSIKNGRENNLDCDALAQPVTGGSEKRGQSDCLLVGKYMRIDRGDITIYSVLARPNGGTFTGSDIQNIEANYVYNIDSTLTDEQSMEWGTQIAWPASGSGSQSPTTPRTIGILFMRSPDTGNVYTFTNDTIPDKLSIGSSVFTDLIAAGATGAGHQYGRTLCVLSSGIAPSGNTAIYINPFAASASAIEVRTNGQLQALGETTRC